jgi:hypothetical protein
VSLEGVFTVREVRVPTASTWPFIMSMAKTSNSNSTRRREFSLAAVCLGALAAWWPISATACPFCKALVPTLCQLREQATIVALVEVRDQTDKESRLVVHRVLVGADRLESKSTLKLKLDVAARPGSLLVIFGTGASEGGLGDLAWHAVAVDETSYAYFARAPSLKVPPAERLAYFAGYLEHPSALVAEDAYFEFGHATFEEVIQAAGSLPFERLRAWLADPGVPPERKGFYGVALGLAPSDDQRRQGAQLLRKIIDEPDDGFRVGFDGVLGGYLLLEGTEGLALVDERYLANPRSADGDVRHALAALRFAHEYVRSIPQARLQAAIARLLDRPAVAAAAITDLARLRDWGHVERVGRLYSEPEYADKMIRHAIIGYLSACPEERGRQELARLRSIDPQAVAEAEAVLSRTSGLATPAE